MPQDDFRIFLSAVTSEFGRARDAVAGDLRSRKALLRMQSDFRQEAESDTTLQKLHDYIRGCSAVVCIIDRRSGAMPTRDPGLQRAFSGYIVNKLGLDRDYFTNVDELARKILKQDWPRKRTGKPITLPYPSLGSLFKGRNAFVQNGSGSLLRPVEKL